MSLVGILGILIVLGLIIGFHEFGHFIVAKLTGMGVHEFSFGFGPPLFQKKVRDTTYSVRMIPLGGFVRIAGMELEDSEEDRVAPNSFNNKPYLAKFATILAGAFMNMVLALFVFIIIGMAVGYPKPGNRVFVAGVMPSYPADKAGLQNGDYIIEINGVHAPLDNQTVVNEIRNGKPPVRLVVERDGKPISLTIQPQKIDLPEPDPKYNGWLYHMKSYYGIGIATDSTSGGWERSSAGKSIILGSTEVAYRIKDAIAQFASLATMRIKPNQLHGPLFIGNMAYNASRHAVDSRIGLLSFLSLIGLLSIFIGFFNLLPIPALDGSRLLFLTIEAIIRKPFDKQKEAMVHMVGLLLLVGLVLFVTVGDVLSIFGKK